MSGDETSEPGCTLSSFISRLSVLQLSARSKCSNNSQIYVSVEVGHIFTIPDLHIMVSLFRAVLVPQILSGLRAVLMVGCVRAVAHSLC